MFVVATVISVIFFITKFIEMRFIDKESKPLKYLIRDSFLVYFSVIISNFVMDQLNPIMTVGGSSGASLKITPAFTDNPGF
jgi:hypothetical protein